MGRYDLGLSDEEFGRLTPERYEALLGRWRVKQRREDARAALIASILANAYRDSEARPDPWRIDDFGLMLAMIPEEIDVAALTEEAKPAPVSAQVAELSSLIAVKE